VRGNREEGLGGEKEKGQGLLGKTPLSSSPIQNRGGPTGRPAWGSAAACERGKRGEDRGDPTPALTSSSDGPWMALRGGGGGAMGGNASLLVRCGAVRRWRRPFYRC
jgi:hypothetical protein